ncbi:MAG: diguanylate cyclase [Negativicutes bacterium]
MELNWEYAPIHLACLLGILFLGLLINHSINRKVKEQLRQSEERFKKLILSTGVMNSEAASMGDDSLLTLLHEITEQKVKSVAGNSQELLSMAADLAHLAPWQYHQESGLFEFDDTFYAVYATDTAAEGALMSPQEYVRKFVHPEDAALVAAEISKMYINSEQRYTHAFDHRIIRRDGEIRTILVRSDIVKDHDGKVKKCYGVNQDITERKVMEADLQNSRDILSLAAELASLGPWKFHPETGLFEFGDEFYAIFGTSVAQEGSFKTPEEYIKGFVHPEDMGLFESPDLKKNYIHRIIRKDGETRIVAIQANIITDDAGKIINWYGAMQDVTEQKQAEATLSRQTEQICHIAYTDALTGLSNRMHMNEWVESEMEKTRLGTSAGSVLFIDLDDLKTVNDTLGHTYGDAIIIEAANRIKSVFCEDAFVGRFGGDEFLVIVPGKSERQVIAPIADRVIHALCQDIEVFDEVFRLSASIGIAVYPEDGATAEELLKNVDNAMYFAKNSGKNCWKFYDAQMQMVAYEKMLLTKNLHHAIENNEFELYYQPQINIARGTIVGFEALIRWNTLEDGLVSPDRFIPVAEQSGLIKSIGNWVLQEACRFARRLADFVQGYLFSRPVQESEALSFLLPH